MGAALVALLLTQDFELVPEEAPETPPPARDETPLVIPPPDGPVPDGVPKGEDAPPLKPHVPLPQDEQRRALLVERQHLLDSRPSYVPPIALSVVGGVSTIFGAGLLGMGVPRAIHGQVVETFIIGLPMTLLGLAAFGFGLVWVRERVLDREPYDERIHEIERELFW